MSSIELLREKFKTGKNSRTEDAGDLLLSNYVDHDVVQQKYAAAIAEATGVFDSSENILPSEWMMLLNNKYGDCVPAGIMEAQFVLSTLGGHHFERTDQAAEWNYENMGGWDPANAVKTDQGCDLRVAAKVWQKTGVLDGNKTPRHSGAYLFLEPGNIPLLFWAVKELKAAVLGYNLPQSAMEQSEQAEEEGHKEPVWTYEPDSPSEGGHCVPSFGRLEVSVTGSGLIVAKSVSWGMSTMIAHDFIENKMDDGFVVVSSSMLKEGQIDGLDHEQLLNDAQNYLGEGS